MRFPLFHFCFAILIFATVTPKFAFAQDFEIGHTTLTFVDPERGDRNILTEIYYPADKAGEDVDIAIGEFPVVSFGHGFVMIWSAYENIWTELVPSGYIVALPRTEGNIFPNHQNLGVDLAFVADAIVERGNQRGSLFEGHTLQSAAIGGHSMGGGASYLGANESQYVKTIFSFAAADTNPSAINAAAEISLPSLVIASSSDDVSPQATNSIPIYENLLSKDSKLFVSILGGGHCFFANSNFNCDFGELGSSGNITISRDEQQQATIDYLLPWLQRHLRLDCSQYNITIANLGTDKRIDFMTNIPTPGDLDSNGLVNLLDIQPFVDQLTAGNYLPQADLNCDNAVNLLDVGPFVDLLEQ